MDTKKLPKMPRPMCNYADHSYPAFSKAQMEEYALAAIAAAGAPDLRSAKDEHAAFDEWFTAKGFAGYRESMWAAWQARAALASAAPVEADPLATITLGGIEGDEYGNIDIEVISIKALEEMQNKLVRTEEPVFVHLYADARAIEARIMGGVK